MLLEEDPLRPKGREKSEWKGQVMVIFEDDEDRQLWERMSESKKNDILLGFEILQETRYNELASDAATSTSLVADAQGVWVASEQKGEGEETLPDIPVKDAELLGSIEADSKGTIRLKTSKFGWTSVEHLSARTVECLICAGRKYQVEFREKVRRFQHGVLAAIPHPIKGCFSFEYRDWLWDSELATAVSGVVALGKMRDGDVVSIGFFNEKSLEFEIDYSAIRKVSKSHRDGWEHTVKEPGKLFRANSSWAYRHRGNGRNHDLGFGSRHAALEFVVSERRAELLKAYQPLLDVADPNTLGWELPGALNLIVTDDWHLLAVKELPFNMWLDDHAHMEDALRPVIVCAACDPSGAVEWYGEVKRFTSVRGALAREA